MAQSVPMHLQKVTKIYIPAETPNVPAKGKTRQQSLLGEDSNEPTAATVVTAAAQEAKKKAKAAEVARVAMGMRSFAMAADALRRIPGGGALADTLLRSLDVSANKGGTIKRKGNALVREKPKPEVGFLPILAQVALTVAPYAMKFVGPAVTAARNGLAKFGPAIVSNLSAAGSFIASKAGPLLAKAAAIPGVAAVAAFAKKALTTAGVALGIGTAAAAVTESGRAKLKEGLKRAYRIARTGTEAVAQGAAATASEAGGAIVPEGVQTAWRYLPYAAAAFLAFKVLT